MRQCSGPLLGILLMVAAPAPVFAQGEPVAAPAPETAGGPVSHRALAGHLFVPSHLVQDPFSYTSAGLFWGVGGGDAIGPTLDLGPPPRIDFVNSRSYGFNGLGLGMILDARILEWISIHGSAEATAYLGTGNRSLLVLGTNAQITGSVGLKGSLRLGEHVRLAAILDAQYGPVFTALIVQGLIDAVNSGQISLDQFYQERKALTWIPALAGAFAPFPFVGVTMNVRLLFPDGSGNAQFASSGIALAGMVDLDLQAPRAVPAHRAERRLFPPLAPRRLAGHDAELRARRLLHGCSGTGGRDRDRLAAGAARQRARVEFHVRVGQPPLLLERHMSYDDLGANEKMASLRTSLAVQRTRMAAERTLMATMRTSLSLIGFGFTIFTFFQGISRDNPLGSGIIPPRAPARFGLALVFIGVLVLLLGTLYHVRYMLQLRRQRAEFIAFGYLPGTSSFPLSMSLVTSFLLLLVGLAAILSIMLRVGPFS